MSIPAGKRVLLGSNEREGWPEEWARIVAYQPKNDVYTVRVERSYRDGPMDDGLREVTAEQMLLEEEVN